MPAFDESLPVDGAVPVLSELPDDVPDFSEDPDFDELSPLLTVGADGESPAFDVDWLPLGADVGASLFISSVLPPLEHPASIPTINAAAAVKPIHFFMLKTPLSYQVEFCYEFHFTRERCPFRVRSKNGILKKDDQIVTLLISSCTTLRHVVYDCMNAYFDKNRSSPSG